jgi:uncharacterized tellurite resistance protein B-like protein
MRLVAVVKSFLRSWLGLESSGAEPHDALRGVVDALERLEPDRARYLAQFAYLLGRVAHADQHVSGDETRLMEQLVAEEGSLPADQALLVVALAKSSTHMFGGTDNFLVAREFAEATTYEQKVSLVRCLFALSAVEGNISIAEEREVQRIARELRVEPADLVRLRLEYRRHLPGLSDRE